MGTMKYFIIINLLLFLCSCSSDVVKQNSDQVPTYDEQFKKRLAQEAFIDGTILETKGLYNDAIIKFTEAYKFDPQPGISYTLAKNYLKINKLSVALTYAKKAAEQEPENIEYQFLLASTFNSSHLDDSSAFVYDRIIKLDSTNVSAYFNLAQLYEANRPNEAITLYKKILNLIGPEWSVLVRLIEINERLGNVDETIKTVEELITLNPAELNLQKVLVESYIKVKKYDKALKVLDEASPSYPDDINLIEYKGIALAQKGEIKKASEEYLKLIKRKEVNFENKLRIGVSFLVEAEKDSNNIKYARNIFEEMNHDTSDWQVNAYLGEIAFKQKKDSAAVKYFEKATDLAEWNPQVWVRLGGLLFDSRKYDQSIRFMQKAAEKFPNDFTVNLIYGLSLSQKNDHQKAADILRRALNINPNDVTALGALGYTLNQLKKDDEALEILHRALKLDPDNLQVISVTALIHESKKNYLVSDSLYARALKLDSANVLIQNNYAYSLAERGIRLEEALRLSLEAVKNEPKNSSYLDTLGWIYYKLGDFKKAKENIESAIEMEKDNATLVDHLGDVYFKLGNRKKAVELWKKAFSMDESKSELKLKIDKGEL
jgi:tetratricopeptide (TPR) repeat protein